MSAKTKYVLTKNLILSAQKRKAYRSVKTIMLKTERKEQITQN